MRANSDHLLNAAKQTTALGPNWIFYSHFSEYPSNSTTVYDWGARANVNTSPIVKTTTNSYLPNVPVLNYTATAAFDAPLQSPIGAGNFTIEMWARVPSGSTNQIGIMFGQGNNGATSGNIQLACGINNGVLYSPTNWGTNNNTNIAIPANTWFHWCLMRVGTTLHRFFNGSPTTSVTFTKNLTYTYATVGAYSSGTRRFFTGNLSEFQISKVTKYSTSGFTPLYPLDTTPAL